MSFDYTFEALATKWWIKVFDNDNFGEIDELFQTVESIAKSYEKQYSRFLDDSFISKLNRQNELTDFPDELYQMLIYSENIRLNSEGLFNVAVGGILENIGYDKNYSFNLKKDVKSVVISEQSSFEILTQEKIKIKSGVKVDLGGMGKGWLIDKIAATISKSGVKYFSINGGGDIYATSNFDTGIEFALEHPLDLTQKIGSITINNLGIACSSPNRRAWKDVVSDQRFHHLIDIKNSNSAEGKLAVFTQAKNALLADVMSTTLFVAKNEQIEDLAKKFEVEFLIIFPDLSFVKSKGYLGQLYS